LYLYEIKVEGYVEPEPDPVPDPTPTTIVKPNITNVVRPVVKVVVTPPAPKPDSEPDPEPEIMTVVEEAELEVESDASEELEVMATVEEFETEELECDEEIEAEAEIETEEEIEEDPEIEDILASIPSADDEVADENAVDAIDIFWEERTHKTYRYDPDGNTVEEGDVVLVPTRDEESDKEVIREAEVVRGNYKVDPATLDRPLKKIIGVVRRKAEQIFTAMITPIEENEDQK
jgi:hypothetical protein